MNKEKLVLTLLMTLSTVLFANDKTTIELPDTLNTVEVFKLKPYPVSTVSTDTQKQFKILTGLAKPISNARVVVVDKDGSFGEYRTDGSGWFKTDSIKQITKLYILDLGPKLEDTDIKREMDSNLLVIFGKHWRSPSFIDLEYFPADNYYLVVDFNQ